jgi:Amidase
MLCFGAATSWFPVQSRFGFRSRSDCGARLKRANSASVKKSRRNWISTANSGQQGDSASRAESTRVTGVDRPQSGRRFGRRPQGRSASIIGRPIGEADFAPFNAAIIAYGCSLTTTQYSASIDAMRKAGQSIARELDRFDVFVTPTLTQAPRPIGYWSMEDGDRVRYLARVSDAALMFAFNISGLPTISIPVELTGENAPSASRSSAATATKRPSCSSHDRSNRQRHGPLAVQRSARPREAPMFSSASRGSEDALRSHRLRWLVAMQQFGQAQVSLFRRASGVRNSPTDVGLGALRSASS